MSERKLFRFTSDGNYHGTRVYAPDGTDISDSVLGMEIVIADGVCARASIDVLATFDIAVLPGWVTLLQTRRNSVH